MVLREYGVKALQADEDTIKVKDVLQKLKQVCDQVPYCL